MSFSKECGKEKVIDGSLGLGRIYH